MSKAFLIMFEKDMTTPKQRNDFHAKLTADKEINGWWHHITNAYIILTSDAITSTKVRDFTQKILPNINVFVLRVNYNDYDGFLNQNAWDWMENSLKKVNNNKGFGF